MSDPQMRSTLERSCIEDELDLVLTNINNQLKRTCNHAEQEALKIILEGSLARWYLYCEEWEDQA
jgi:hypothetical protein